LLLLLAVLLTALSSAPAAVQIERAEVFLEEIRLLKENRPTGGNTTCWAGSPFWSFLYRCYICGFKSPAGAYDAQVKYTKKLHSRREQQQAQGLQLTGQAIVLFNYERHAKNMMRDHERIAEFLRGKIAPASVRAFHKWTRAHLLLTTSVVSPSCPIEWPPQRGLAV
jgi:hypothetical protein